MLTAEWSGDQCHFCAGIDMMRSRLRKGANCTPVTAPALLPQGIA
ncbi:hypothetical protein [Laspinema olomoucense]|nr:hypothetical protein [Laspinema sp. D3c]